MTKNGRQGLKMKKRTNPVYRPKVRVPRPKIQFDGQYLNGTHVYTPITTGGVTPKTASALYFVDGGTVSATVNSVFKESIPINLDAIVNKYNEFVYESLVLEWIPAISPGLADAGAQITVAYVDNPEQIVTCNSLTSPNLISMNQLVRNMRSFNAWERFTVTIPLSRRLSKFNVNSTGTVVTDVNAVERSVQGLVTVGFSSITDAVVLGSFRSRYRIKLFGLNYGQST